MKLQDVSQLWSDFDEVAILSLPFISYAVEPHFLNRFVGESRKEYRISYKGSFPYPIETYRGYDTVGLAKKACEEHLERLVNYLFSKLDGVIDFEVENPSIKKDDYSNKVYEH